MANGTTNNTISSRAGRGNSQGSSRIAARPIHEQAGVLFKRRQAFVALQKTVRQKRVAEWRRMSIPAVIPMGAMASTSTELAPIAGLPSIREVFPEFDQGGSPIMGAVETNTSNKLAPIAGLPSICDVFPGICPGSDPLPMPASQCRAVPMFKICRQQNCGKHPEKQPWWKWPYPATTCHKCFRPSSPQEMHALPCGHALCHGCLEQAVAKIDANVNDEGCWAEISAHLEEHWAATTHNGVYRQLDRRQPVLSNSPLSRALAAAGFQCCGINMHLERYMGCMSPRLARAIWLAYEAISWPLEVARNRCGWPDCGQLVTPTCSYVRNHATVYHCLHCQGNSFYVSEGNLIPAR